MTTIKILDFPNIRTKRLTLRIPTVHDIPNIFRYYQDNEERFKPTHPIKESDFYTEAFWKKRIQAAETEFQEGKSIRLFLFDSQNEKEVVGTINFNEIVRGVFQASYVGYDVSGKYEGQGLMHEGLDAAIKYAFSSLNLHRIMANYQPYNTRSGNVLKRLGFTIEGTAKDYLLINGEWKDHVLTSLTNPQWKKLPATSLDDW